MDADTTTWAVYSQKLLSQSRSRHYSVERLPAEPPLFVVNDATLDRVPEGSSALKIILTTVSFAIH